LVSNSSVATPVPLDDVGPFGLDDAGIDVRAALPKTGEAIGYRQNNGVSPAMLTTSDGERIAALHLPGPDDADRPLGVVVAHGFTGSTRKPGVRAVLHALARHAGVIGFDFRGHGRSSGHSTLGDREVLDLDAAVGRARELGYRDVVTCGWSMGGSVVLRHAALIRGVDAVVSVSAVSRWYYRDTKPMRRVHWAVETRMGRLVARRAFGTRISTVGWSPVPESPVEVVGRIAPTPLLLVHGDADHYFPVEHPEALFEAAAEPKELWLLPGYGHAEAAATPELLDRIGAHLPALVARGRG
jgi:pimeloyl-ACP methyl ester carboxylesterase